MSEQRSHTAASTSSPTSSSGHASGAGARSSAVAVEGSIAVAGASPSDSPHIRIEMVSQARYLAGARAMIASVAQRFGFSECDCGQIALALDEALCNVIKHGYERRSDGVITISVWPVGDPPQGVQIQIDDRGKQVDVAVIRSRRLDDIRPGGLGVFLINQIMDEARYSKREGGGMRLTMVKYLVKRQCDAAGGAVASGGSNACCGGEADCRDAGSGACSAASSTGASANGDQAGTAARPSPPDPQPKPRPTERDRG